jgi:AcrR family transcriptional regulator
VSIIPNPTGGQATVTDESPWQPGRKRRRDHALKREAVIRAAARAFHARGFHNTSLDDVAATLQVTKPTLYYYVRSKEELLFQCFLAGLEGIEAGLAQALQSPASGRERLQLVLRRYAVAIASEFGWCMVRAEDQDLAGELSAQIRARKGHIDQGIRTLIRAGIEDGSVAPCDPKMTAFALAGALNWIAHWHRQDDALGPEAIADQFVAFFENGLLPRPAAREEAARTARRTASPPPEPAMFDLFDQKLTSES